MPFTITSEPLDFPLPAWRLVRQRFEATREADVAAAVHREMAKLDGRIRPGMTVAVGVGSRGLASLATLVRATVEALAARGAKPIVMPAMGSHGGATPEGQLRVLAEYGVTPESVGAPIDPSMETVRIGVAEGNLPVHFGRAALAADAVLVVNRVKPHTSFHGRFESGLAKMLTVGFGKHAGATEMHQRGMDRLPETIPAALAVVLEEVRVLGGLATVENARDEVALVEFVPGEAITAREPALLERARALLPRIPFDRLDVLIVDRIGKDVSGTGMDPNVTRRHTARHLGVDPLAPQRIVVLRLTERTHGNAHGLGVADITTRDVIESIDYQKGWTNAVASQSLDAARTPLWMPTDREAIALALLTAPGADRTAPRLVRIGSTLELETFRVSEALWQAEGRHRPDLEPLAEAEPMAFGPDGRLADLPPPRTRHGRAPWTD
ncbi:MAG TPA: DUF362 domain-containing protein [Thermodesulfobacteriota bacterium]